MENTFLLLGSKKLVENINSIAIKKSDDIEVLNYDIADPSYLSLYALNPTDLKDLWEIITVLGTISGAVGFFKDIKSLLSTSNNEVTIRTVKGTTITLSKNTSDIEIEEYAKKTIIRIKV